MSTTVKDYCSRVCGAKCCRAHPPLVSPPHCPMLRSDNLCSIYEHRIGFRFYGTKGDGRLVPCVCAGREKFLKTLPPEMLAQCCVAHPELLDDLAHLRPNNH